MDNIAIRMIKVLMCLITILIVLTVFSIDITEAGNADPIVEESKVPIYEPVTIHTRIERDYFYRQLLSYSVDYIKEITVDNTLNITELLNSRPTLQSIIVEEAIQNDELIFIGNSLVEGLRLNSGTSNIFTCKVGVSLDGLYDNGIYNTILNSKFKVAVIEMGTNELGGYKEERFKTSYINLINTVKESNPEAIVYCVSIPPTSSTKSRTSRFNNKNVQIYNQYIRDVCEQTGSHYIDCTEMFGDVLDSNWSRDGIHLSSSIYKEWYDYIISKL